MVSTFIEELHHDFKPINVGSNSSSWTLSVEQARQSLEYIFRTSSDLSADARDQLLQGWHNVWEPFSTEKDRYSLNKYHRSISELVQRMRQFRDSYAAQMDAEMLDSVDSLSAHLPAVANVSLGLSLISKKVAQQRKSIKALEILQEGFKLIAKDLVLFSDWIIRDPKSKDVVVDTVSNLADINHLNDWFDKLAFESKAEREAALEHKFSISMLMKAVLWDLSAISGDSDFVPFILDGEVTYLSANSAEGKAIRRMSESSFEDDTDWIIVEPDDEIDIESMRERIASRGYKLSTEN